MTNEVSRQLPHFALQHKTCEYSREYSRLNAEDFSFGHKRQRMSHRQQKSVFSAHAVSHSLLLKAGADIDSSDNSGYTPLQFAVAWRSQKLVRLLLENGADVEKADNEGLRPLHLAAGRGDLVILSMLLERGADLHATTLAGLTPLHCAENKQRQAAAELLRFVALTQTI